MRDSLDVQGFWRTGSALYIKDCSSLDREWTIKPTKIRPEAELKTAIPRHWLASQFSQREDPNPLLP